MQPLQNPPLCSSTISYHRNILHCVTLYRRRLYSVQYHNCKDSYISFLQPIVTLSDKYLGAAWPCRVRRGYVVSASGCCTNRVRIPPGTPPLVQPRKVQEQESNGADFSQRSSRRYQRSSRRVSPSPRMNIVSIL
jgi:hypothetical protein